MYSRIFVKNEGNAKLLAQQKPASRNQCRYFTLRIKTIALFCIAPSHNLQDNCD